LNNAVYPVWIRVAEGAAAPVPAEQSASAALPPGAGRETAERVCLACHDTALINQQRMDRGRWRNEVEKMIRWGAPVPPDQKDALIEYLYSQFH
jgi:ubiquinol-cytochrome c reductase cytochrome c subunit